MEPKLRHDFLNNCLRLEVLNRLVSETIEKNAQLDLEHIRDLETFLVEHLNYIKQIKKL